MDDFSILFDELLQYLKNVLVETKDYGHIENIRFSLVYENKKWILCPVCKSKTRTKIRDDTILENFPLFCPKCKQETLINIRKLNLSVITEPDAETQSQ